MRCATWACQAENKKVKVLCCKVSWGWRVIQKFERRFNLVFSHVSMANLEAWGAMPSITSQTWLSSLCRSRPLQNKSWESQKVGDLSQKDSHQASHPKSWRCKKHAQYMYVYIHIYIHTAYAFAISSLFSASTTAHLKHATPEIHFSFSMNSLPRLPVRGV